MLCCCLLLVAGLLPGVRDVGAVAWVQERGHGYYGLTSRATRTDRFYQSDGTVIDIPTFGDYTIDFYGEYGVHERVTGTVYLPFKRITLNEQVGQSTGFVFFPGDSKTGIADGQVGIRYGLVRGSATVVSGVFVLGLPLGDDGQPNGLLTGAGELNQIYGLEIGHSGRPGPWYWTGFAGFNNRTGGYSDEVRYSTEIAGSWRSVWTLALKVRGVYSLRNGDDAVTGGMGGLYANNQSHLVLGPELLYQAGARWGVQLGVVGAAYGRNVLAAPQWSLGLFYRD